MKAVRCTYDPGQYSQVNLPDGTKVLISVGFTEIRVVKLGLLNIPTGTVWAFDLGFPIRPSPSTTTEKAKIALDTILAIVEGSQTLPEVEGKLSINGAPLLASLYAAERTGEKPVRASRADVADAFAKIVFDGREALRGQLEQHHLLPSDRDSSEFNAFLFESLVLEWCLADLVIGNEFGEHADGIRTMLTLRLCSSLLRFGTQKEDISPLVQHKRARFLQYYQVLRDTGKHEVFDRLGSIAWQAIAASNFRSPAGEAILARHAESRFASFMGIGSRFEVAKASDDL